MTSTEISLSSTRPPGHAPRSGVQAPAQPSPGPLRIGLFMDDFFPNSGGIARSVELQIDQLVSAGHQVTLFAPRHQLRHGGRCRQVALPAIHLPGLPSWTCSVQFGARPVRTIRAAHGDFDVVHSQTERGALFLAAGLARVSGAAHVHTFHANYAGTHATSPVLSGLNSLSWLPIASAILGLTRSDLPRRRSRGRVADEPRPLARRDWRQLADLAHLVDLHTSPAQFALDALDAAATGALHSRARLVANGVDQSFLTVRRQRPAGRTTRFLSCGRLSLEKRTDDIIRAYAALDDPDTELFILGDGNEENRLRSLAAQIVRRGRVVFLGRYDDHSLVAQEMADADVMVLASRGFDTQAMVLAEAAAARTPILYRDDRLIVGTTGGNALLVPDDGLAAGMRHLADHAHRRRAMSTAAATLAPTLGAEAMGQAYLAAYRDAMAVRDLRTARPRALVA